MFPDAEHCYLSVIIDLFQRCIEAFSIGNCHSPCRSACADRTVGDNQKFPTVISGDNTCNTLQNSCHLSVPVCLFRYRRYRNNTFSRLFYTFIQPGGHLFITFRIERRIFFSLLIFLRIFRCLFIFGDHHSLCISRKPLLHPRFKRKKT